MFIVFGIASHQNRLGPDDAKTPMCRAVDPNYLQMLLEWQKQPDWIEVVESLPKAGGQGAEVRVDLQTPFKPATFREFAVGKSETGLRRASEQTAGKSESGLRQLSEEVRVKLDLSEEPSNEEKSEEALRSEARGAVTRGTVNGLIAVL